MSNGESTPVRRFQVIAVSVVGVIAGLCFLGSFLAEGESASTLRTAATVAAGICALIGVSFAFTGGDR